MATTSEAGTNRDGRAGRPTRTAAWPRKIRRRVVVHALSVLYRALGLGRFYRRALLFERDCGGRPVPSSDGPLILSELSADDLEAYKRYRPERDPAGVLARLAAGERCFVAWRDDRIVSDAWAVSERTVLPQQGIEIHIAADLIWLADSWVLPELRGRNIATQRSAMMTDRLAAEGYTRAVYHISARDRSALGPARKLEARCLGSFGYLRLGPLRLDFEHMHGNRVRWMRSSRRPRVITLT